MKNYRPLRPTTILLATVSLGGLFPPVAAAQDGPGRLNALQSLNASVESLVRRRRTNCV